MELTIDLLKRVFDYIPSCIYFKDTECKYVYASKFMNDPLGAEKYDVNGLTDFDIQKDPVEAQRAYDLTKQVLETRKGVTFVNDFSLPDKPIFLEFKMEPVFDDNNEIMGVIGIMNDITERIVLEKKLETFARTDILTGLFNRFYLDFWRTNEMKPSLLPLCIVQADCDGLKKMNDTYGHQVGDEYLHLSSAVLRVALPEKAIKFRTGGDEFLALIPNTDLQEGRRLVEHMEGLAKHMTIKDKAVSISFGVSCIESISDDFDVKLEEADQEMYKEKQLHHKAR